MSVSSRKKLIVVTGPTASGKTDLAIRIALATGSEIISADSRQIYRDIPIGTAAPTPEQLSQVRHHLVGSLDLEDYYSAARFEHDASAILADLWRKSDIAVVCGGAMLYVDTLCYGIDELPDISDDVRKSAWRLWEEGGIEAVRNELMRLDPIYYNRADLDNHKRMIHAIEVSMQASKPYSSFLSGKKVQRDFDILKIAIDMDRDTLFNRINRRVDRMIEAGMEEEALRLYPKRHLNSLNTVGYKELFMVMDGKMDRTTAIARIAKNTRVYAKKQLTWMKKDENLQKVSVGNEFEEAMKMIEKL